MTASSSTSHAVHQADNVAHGHIAGGDINALTVEGDLVLQQQPESPLRRLYKRLSDEAAGDPELTEYIGQLQIFTRTVAGETVVGLDGKLSAAERNDQLDMAKAMKELVYSQLRQNMFSRTFQTIYATLMGKIYEQFQTWVRPAIVAGAGRAEIDKLVHVHVVLPIVAELEACPECTDAPIQTVRGMIYFLTGNCHLQWH